MSDRAIILVNVGTPEKPDGKQLRRYLSGFLNDPRVIDIPWLFRKILVNLIIIPFRTPKSARLYRRLWTTEGSPLLIYLNRLVEKLNQGTDKKDIFFGAMRYGEPSLEKTLLQVKAGQYREILVLPLYPQYASSTTGTTHEKVMSVVKKWDVIPGIRFLDQFYSHPSFIKAVSDLIRAHDPSEYDHVVFSYHGLPLRHIRKVHPGIDCNTCSCSEWLPPHGTHCYKASCYETTRLLAAELGLEKGRYTTSFQSRLSKNWLSPFTDDTITTLAKNGCKRILVTAPSFVADCLETSIEIGEDYRDLFLGSGGEKFDLVESLNDHENWVKAVRQLTNID